jgi:hypothetical protein
VTNDGAQIDASTLNNVCSVVLGANVERGDVHVNFNNLASARR